MINTDQPSARQSTSVDAERNSQSHSQVMPEAASESVYDLLQDAGKYNVDNRTFFTRVVHILFATTWATIISLLFLIVPISMLIVGITFVDSCPAHKFIPIYLLVAGVVNIVLRIFNVVTRCRSTQQERLTSNRTMSPFEIVIISFLVGWFIAGCCFIYGIKGTFQYDDTTKTNYCNRNLYFFAFWLVTSHFIFAFLCVIGAVIGAVVLAMKVKDPVQARLTKSGEADIVE